MTKARSAKVCGLCMKRKICDNEPREEQDAVGTRREKEMMLMGASGGSGMTSTGGMLTGSIGSRGTITGFLAGGMLAGGSVGMRTGTAFSTLRGILCLVSDLRPAPVSGTMKR